MVSLGIFEFLDTAKQDGRIIHVGFSFHGDKKLFKEIVDAYHWEFCQIQYNILDEENQAGTEGLQYAFEKDLGIIIMEPLRGGSLSGKVPKDVQKLWDSANEKRSPAEWALRWIWNHPQVRVILSGMNVEEHIQENIKTASIAHPNSLSKSELQLVEKVRDTYRCLMKIGCTGCNYCMPCPAGVNIPQCFERYNNKYLFDVKGRFPYYMWVGGLLSKPSYASLCIECGKCEKHCPQHIPIRKELKHVSKQMEGPMMKPIVWLGRNVMSLMGKFSTTKVK
jgi:predicted aldo/keto reductase-like oxidoreductase